jgi:predicted nucleic acid-binding protein
VIVADTNLLVYLFVPGDLTTQAEAVFERDPGWLAPLLWRSEFRSVLIGLIRGGSLTGATARDIANRAESWMSGREYAVSTDQVLKLAEMSRCSSYDCEFIAVAQTLGAPLVTADRQLLRAFPSVAVAPSTFVKGRG